MFSVCLCFSLVPVSLPVFLSHDSIRALCIPAWHKGNWWLAFQVYLLFGAVELHVQFKGWPMNSAPTDSCQKWRVHSELYQLPSSWMDHCLWLPTPEDTSKTYLQFAKRKKKQGWGDQKEGLQKTVKLCSMSPLSHAVFNLLCASWRLRECVRAREGIMLRNDREAATS